MSATLSLSREMEDYLETIASLIASGGEARVTDIAERLSVRKPSVTLALRSLAEKGLVNYQPYALPTLTETGRMIASRIQHRHDVLKRFLMDVLLIKNDIAEANACRLEHAVDKEVLDHLAQFVDFVQRCPRGGATWIRGYEYHCDPEGEHERCERCMNLALDEYRTSAPEKEPSPMQTTLDQIKAGQEARIVRVGTKGAIRRRIVDMGAVAGTAISVVKVAPLGDPIEVKVKGYSLTLRKEEAKSITVELPGQAN
jgi:DtxR family Mn-dependent transcriptional regulator